MRSERWILGAMLLGLVSCASSSKPAPALNVPTDDELAVWESLEGRSRIQNQDALTCLYRLASTGDPATLRTAWSKAIDLGWIDAETAPDAPATFGSIAVAAHDLLDLPTGLTQRVLGPGPRVCLRSLVYHEIVPARSTGQIITGSELLELLGIIDDSIREGTAAALTQDENQPTPPTTASSTLESDSKQETPDALTADKTADPKLRKDDKAKPAPRAIVIEAKGKAQWRPKATAAWQTAKVNDKLPPESEIRTGLRSSVTLRIADQATVRLGRASRLQLPAMLSDAKLLTTRATLRRGKVDVKVDSVGLENDFRVVTPTSTLAVRGTAFTISWGPLRGTEVIGAPTNELRAIELRYNKTGQTVHLTANDQSTDHNPHPARNKLARGIHRPPTGAFEPKGPGRKPGDRLEGFDREFKRIRKIETGGSDIGTKIGDEFDGGGPPPHAQDGR